MVRLIQFPQPDSRSLHCSGDFLVVTLEPQGIAGGRAFVRGNFKGTHWEDIPMARNGSRFEVTIPLSAVGLFHFKTYYLPDGVEGEDSQAIWPDGGNALVKVAPGWTRQGCSVYTAFVRQFRDEPAYTPPDDFLKVLDHNGYSLIPPSGTFRGLKRRLDHIIQGMGFRIIQLLPIHPVPTTYARMGRFGSPFASLDFYDVDPALAEFDTKATPLDQFIELADAVHKRGARLFLDLPANHTGWASTFQIHHPEWFRRNDDGSFHSPGAWGVVWADLVELDYSHQELRSAIADVFLFWCAKGVDGFRCDAGYMIPADVWKFVVDAVRKVFPETVFLLEGLGGKLETTDKLLSESGLDWAYSEIFQQDNRDALSWYLPDAIARSEAFGPLIHFAETHDNNRLAAQGNGYAAMRTALAALLSQQGAFGITAGVEWFCREKIDVHGAPSLAWGAQENQIVLISRLNAILAKHPAFAIGASIELITRGGGNVIAAIRKDNTGEQVLVAVNLDSGNPSTVEWDAKHFPFGEAWDLISARKILPHLHGDSSSLNLPAGGFVALVASEGAIREIEAFETMRKSALALEPPFKNQVSDSKVMRFDFPVDSRRTVMVPPGYALEIHSRIPFRALLADDKNAPVSSATSLPTLGNSDHCCQIEVPDSSRRRNFTLSVVGFDEKPLRTQSPILALPSAEDAQFALSVDGSRVRQGEDDLLAVLANRRGSMAQVRAAWGTIQSQYDALLALNPDPNVPSDRQIFFTRCRAWVRHAGYSFELNSACLDSFELRSPRSALWRFTTPIGMGKTAKLFIALEMDESSNAVTLVFGRHSISPSDDKAPVALILRPDIEARSFHCPTLAYQGAEQSYPAAVQPFENGFHFEHSSSLPCQMLIDDGCFTYEPIWSYSVPHPVEAERGLSPSGDLFSPGWFATELNVGAQVRLIAGEKPLELLKDKEVTASYSENLKEISLDDYLSDVAPSLLFIADRDDLKTVIAGYPWFLDWGRDTLIVLRGLIAMGETAVSMDILREFGRFEEHGTLPNIIHGGTVGNRDTSDAPLWFIVAAGDAMNQKGSREIASLDCGGRPLSEVILSIVSSYLAGTSNGIKVDKGSGLVYSPSHFTWMDTNYPAGTPRIGYPIEIQALWIAALTIVRTRLHMDDFVEVENLARSSLLKYFVQPEGWLADSLRTPSSAFAPAASAIPEDALRPNQLLAVTLGAVDANGVVARAVVKATESLLIPGGIRSLADRPVTVEQPVWRDGILLNDPFNPYWGHYLGDEDTRRKPAYHNGTAWGWQFPLWCEAFAIVFGDIPAARSILASAATLLESGSLGQLPEIMDGDTPHKQRGCLAQAWSISELERVNHFLTLQKMV